MTALDEHPPPATGPAAGATETDLATFRAAARAYAELHRHEQHAGQLAAAAQRAGLAAVLADRGRHPAGPSSVVSAGLKQAHSLTEVAAYCRAGWEPTGSSTLATGETVYWLARAEPTGDGAP